MAKKIRITLLPEWETELNQLRNEQFYDKSQSDMFKYIISRGLDALKQEKAKDKKGGEN